MTDDYGQTCPICKDWYGPLEIFADENDEIVFEGCPACFDRTLETFPLAKVLHQHLKEAVEVGKSLAKKQDGQIEELEDAIKALQNAPDVKKLEQEIESLQARLETDVKNPQWKTVCQTVLIAGQTSCVVRIEPRMSAFFLPKVVQMAGVDPYEKIKRAFTIGSVTIAGMCQLGLCIANPKGGAQEMPSSVYENKRRVDWAVFGTIGTARELCAYVYNPHPSSIEITINVWGEPVDGWASTHQSQHHE